MVDTIPEEERTTFIQRAQDPDEDRFVRQVAASKMGAAPEEARLSFFRQAFSDEDPFVRANAMWKIGVLSVEERNFFVRMAQDDPSPIVRSAVYARLKRKKS